MKRETGEVRGGGKVGPGRNVDKDRVRYWKRGGFLGGDKKVEDNGRKCDGLRDSATTEGSVAAVMTSPCAALSSSLLFQSLHLSTSTPLPPFHSSEIVPGLCPEPYHRQKLKRL